MQVFELLSECSIIRQASDLDTKKLFDHEKTNCVKELSLYQHSVFEKPISLQPYDVNLWYFKLCGKNSIPLWVFEKKLLLKEILLRKATGDVSLKIKIKRLNLKPPPPKKK